MSKSSPDSGIASAELTRRLKICFCPQELHHAAGPDPVTVGLQQLLKEALKHGCSVSPPRSTSNGGSCQVAAAWKVPISQQLSQGEPCDIRGSSSVPVMPSSPPLSSHRVLQAKQVFGDIRPGNQSAADTTMHSRPGNRLPADVITNPRHGNQRWHASPSSRNFQPSNLSSPTMGSPTGNQSPVLPTSARQSSFSSPSNTWRSLSAHASSPTRAQLGRHFVGGLSIASSPTPSSHPLPAACPPPPCSRCSQLG